MNEQTTRILIVEDDPIIALELGQVLQQAGYRVAGKAHTAVRAIDKLAGGNIDFVLLDINLGNGQSGIDIARLLHETYHLPYIFLTAFSDEHTLAAAKEQAPYGYLVKPFQAPTLLSTISVALSNFQRLQRGINFDRLPASLTKQEQRLCEHLVGGKSYQEVADELFISINTVRYHIKNLYLKLDVNSRAELVSQLLDV